MIKRAVLLCLVLAGCKSDEGARCQVDDDCASGLVCNKAKNTCSSSSGGGIDATVPDGPATPIDAAVDATPSDAPIDSTTTSM